MPKKLEKCEVRLQKVTEELEETRTKLTKLKTAINRVMFRTIIVTVLATVTIAFLLHYI